MKTEDNNIVHGKYLEKDLKEFFNETYLIDNGIVCIKKVDHIIHFAVLGFSCSTDDYTEYNCFWYGNGVDGLRECRHSWFGDAECGMGYVFYLNGELMKDAINVLMNYFDMD